MSHQTAILETYRIGREALMSYNRENVVWQSQNGTWNIGFFATIQTNFNDDYDDDWDVEYLWDEFEWASTGHSTSTEATNAWYGVNPGGCNILPYQENNQQAEKYDLMAAYYQNPALKIAHKTQVNNTKNQEHFDALKTQFENNYRYIGLTVKVTTAEPETVHTRLGFTTIYTGKLIQENNWLVLSRWGETPVPVYNTDTNTFAPNIHAIRPSC